MKQISLCLGLFVLCLGLIAPPTAAQTAAELHAKAIEEWLAQPREKIAPIDLKPGTPLAIPAEYRKDLRFGFQKRMALAGHGVLFDVEGNQVELEPDEMDALQNEMLKAAQQDAEEHLDLRFKELAALEELSKEIEEAAFGGDMEPLQAFVARNLLLRTYAYRMRTDLREGYLWRANYLRARWSLTHKLKIGPRLEFLDARLLEWYRTRWILFLESDYMRDCRAAGVPVPPNFALSGTVWAKQGDLGINMLQPGNRADLYTWSAPHDRGACIALPRFNSSNNGTLAGIICQSAATGNACIWDSLRKGTGAVIPWETETMVISQLQDGTELGGCPACHQGNNAFLIAPDEATWCRLLRGGQTGAACSAISGANTHTFTTLVEGVVRPVVSNNGTSHSRFTFMSGSPPRAGWTNNAGLGCGTNCHLAGDFGLLNRPASQGANPPRQTMQPMCGFACY